MKFRRNRFCVVMLAVIALLLAVTAACNNNDEKAEETPRVDPQTEEGVTVSSDKEIMISVFWPPSRGFATQEQYDYLKQANIDILEWGSDPIFTHSETLASTLELCEKNGIKITIFDKEMGGGLENKTEDELLDIVDRYKDYDCVVGYFLVDEPGNANPFGRVTQILTKADPGAICQMNMLPMFALSDPRGHAEDWISSCGEGNLAYLSYDQYPFGLEAGSIPQVFPNMEFVREIGLRYGVDTALYIQSVGVVGSFRRTTVDEMRYHTSAALAYGFKNLKYFTWLTPVDRGNETFTDAIITPEGKPSDSFDGVCDINADIKKVASLLGNLDAVEIYHEGRVDTNTNMLSMLIDEWFLQPQSTTDDCLMSLMKDRTTGRYFLMIVNKDFQNSKTLSFNIKDTAYIIDCTSGVDSQNRIDTTGGSFDAFLKAGGFRLYALPADKDYFEPDYDTNDSNIAKDKPVWTSSSVGSGSYYGYRAVDGVVFSKNAWRGESNDNSAWITIDLRREVSIDRVDVFPAGSKGNVGLFYPHAYKVMVSTDGVNYTEVATYSNSDIPQEVPYFTFDAVNARYVKIEVTDMISFNNQYICEIGEIRIKPTGQELALPEAFPEYIPKETDNYALDKPVYVSSSVENTSWGWSYLYVNDGVLQDQQSRNGWTSATGVHKTSASRFDEEWVLVCLLQELSINEVTLYPRNGGGYFPVELEIQVSNNMNEWTTVYTHKESSRTPSSDARVLSFDDVTAKFVRIVAKEMTNPGGADGYLFSLAEVEIRHK